jgi:hypothetical protein
VSVLAAAGALPSATTDDGGGGGADEAKARLQGKGGGSDTYR